MIILENRFSNTLLSLLSTLLSLVGSNHTTLELPIEPPGGVLTRNMERVEVGEADLPGPEAEGVLVVQPQALLEAEVEDAAAELLQERPRPRVADGRHRRGHRHEEVAPVSLGDTMF